MRSRSSKQAKETERLKLKEEPHLSGAYIRSLVKQLTSSRPKEPMNTKALDGGDGDGFHPNLSNLDEGFSETLPQPQPPPQPKKQVRRRLHTSRPYQERLLNMAEARREIVTALKFHRAAMKQANEQQQQQQQAPPQHDPHPPPSLEPHERIKSRRNPRIYPSNTPHPATPTTFSNYLNNNSLTPFSHHTPPPNPFPWVSPPVAPLPLCDNLNFTLPNQPLGLNLNFHDFNNIDTSLYHYNNNHPSIYTSHPPSSSSSSSSSSSPSPSLSCTEALSIVDLPPNGAYHSAMDDEEMAKIRSIGEQHDMEWNDTLNLVTSARWFKYLKTMDTSPESNEERGDEEGFHWFDEVMDIPAWLTDGVVGNPSESYFLQQHLDDFYSEDMMQDAALPW